ncbi:hypothetical protein JB92DRAFT_3115173 [Gautieria morchelliformis]|nr:hypothetical protein JB92DRAFT_3115173 [Gautieria morchelliformis]
MNYWSILLLSLTHLQQLQIRSMSITTSLQLKVPPDDSDSISKPKGSNGKPSHGGYSSATVLKWIATEYKAVQEYVKIGF